MGTASWTDRTLIDSGWYPPEAGTPEQRLRYYARQFGLVEVDATYYALPAEQTAAAWAARTPAGFTFNVKAFSLFTQHPTRVAALPADLRPDLAMVRLHGHSDKWDSRDIHERFGYRYSGRELGEWAPRIAGLAREARETHVLFNNCYRDYAQVNARQLAALLSA